MAGAPDTAEDDLSNSATLAYYIAAGEVANSVLETLLTKCVEGAKISDLCAEGDALIMELTSKKTFPKKVTHQGVAFPTNIGVNEISGHYAPTPKEDKIVLKNGNTVKVFLGVHFNGYSATAGHTIILGDEKVTDRRADAIMAAWTAAEAALRTVKIGNTNFQVTEAIGKSMEAFGCTSVLNTLSHEHKQDVIDGHNVILPRLTDAGEKFEFEPYTVFGMDILASTGEGKPKEAELKCNIYKREVDMQYSNRSPLTRKFLDIVAAKAGALPFHVRIIGDERCAIMGTSECTRSHVLFPYSVVTEKPGVVTAGFQFTIVLLPGGTRKISGLPRMAIGGAPVESTKNLADKEIQDLLAIPFDSTPLYAGAAVPATSTVVSEPRIQEVVE